MTIAAASTAAGEDDDDNIVVGQRPMPTDSSGPDIKIKETPSPPANDDDDSLLSEPEERDVLETMPTSRDQPRRENQLPGERNNGVEEADDEPVDEGSVDSNDVQPAEFEDDAWKEDTDKEEARSVVNLISSDDEPHARPQSEPNRVDLERPWRTGGFDLSMRRELEMMYCRLQSRPIHGDWDATEDYQREKDKEMLRYLEDYPLDQWVIDRPQANQGFFDMLERTKWRSFGIRIFEQQYKAQVMPNQTQYSRTMAGMQQYQQYQQQPPPNGFPPPQQTPMVALNGQAARTSSQQPLTDAPPNGNHMIPPQQVLRSQPHAVPMIGMPGQTFARQYQHPAQNSAPPMGPPPPPFGHPQHVGGAHGMPQYLTHRPGQQPQPYSQVNGGIPQPIAGFTLPSGALSLGTSTNPIKVDGLGRAVASSPKLKRRKTTPPPPAPCPPVPTPPYKKGERPAERKMFNRSSRRHPRRQAQAEEMPWHRQIDFKKARDEATWDESGYDPKIFEQMEEVRKLNEPWIAALDEEVTEKQRNQRRRKRDGKNTIAAARAFVASGAISAPRGTTPSSDNETAEKPKDATDRAEDKSESPSQTKSETIGGDPYYSGNFSFASEADRQKAAALGCEMPDDVLATAEAGKIDWEKCKDIFICWMPGKKSVTSKLTQAKFRVYDTLITRKQYASTPILTRRAAECLIDFCPDLLWRETLLRIVSEAGCGNKDVRDRMCLNGCYADKATVTKRIAAALGQKQIHHSSQRKKIVEASKDSEGEGEGGKRHGPQPNPKLKDNRWLEGEEAWHEENKKDFDNYIRFFGKRQHNHRLGQTVGNKRKKSEGMGSEGLGTSDGGRSERETTVSIRSSEARDDVIRGKDQSGGHRRTDRVKSEAEEDDVDAVSEQSDTLLDQIED